MLTRRILTFFALVVLASLLFPALVLADAPQPNLALSPDQVWVALAGFLAPLPTYLLNHYAPWCGERVKWVVQTVVAAAVGAVGKLIATGHLDFAHAATWEYIGTAILAAIVGHTWYKAGDVNTKLKAGTNRRRRT